MSSDIYTLAGTVHIPEEKKEEFNRKVMTVLYRCGIRKMETIRVAGKEYTVVVPVRADNNGIALFDYSVFEKRKCDGGCFNTETGELSVSNFGYREFALAMGLIFALQQAYSDTPCLLMEHGKASRVFAYRAMLNTVTGEETVFRNGTDVWENMLLLHRIAEYEDIQPMDAWHINPYRNPKDIMQQILMARMLGFEVKLTDEGGAMSREKIPEALLWQKREYAYRLLMHHHEDPGFEAWLANLLDSDWQEREQMSLRGDDYGTIAELSRYLPSQGIANLYALSRKEGFWEVWDRLGITGYSDFVQENDETGACIDSKTVVFPFYKPTGRTSEDEFLDLWDGENLKLSDKLQDRISQWKNEYRTAEVPSDFEMEDTLAGILEDMRDVWDCRFVDRDFVEDFLEHRDDERYKKLILVLREMLDEDTYMFPELTKKQAVRWAIKFYRDSYDAVLMAVFTSLMANKAQRKRIYGV